MSTANHFPALAVTNVGKSFPTGWRQTFTALDGVSFSVQAGEVVSLIGLNGAGKTTLLKLIAGLGWPDKGAISIFGQTADSAAARSQLGFMPENPQFYPTLTAWQFMLFAGGLYGLDQATTRRRAHKLLKEGELMSAAKRPIGQFSKGMRQRLGFAQACLAQPKLLLLDEPLDGLDPLGRQSLKEQIRIRQKEGATIILCSHILADIAEMSDKVGVIHHGKLLHYGPTAEFQGDRTLEQAFVAFVTQPK